jgi:hypothetical protein
MTGFRATDHRTAGFVSAGERVGDEASIPLDEVVDHRRTQVQRNALADAERSWVAYRSMPSGKRAVLNPFGEENRRNAKRVGTYTSSSRPPMMLGSPQQLFPKKDRRPAWK